MMHPADFRHVQGQPTTCSECGASLRSGESCADRFAELLALDHSRQEPWGSRHGLAFAAYSLQHATTVTSEVLAQCWELLNRVYVHGDDRGDVVHGMRAAYRNTHGKGYSHSNKQLSESWNGAPLPNRNPPNFFTITISDLGTFPADAYAAQLDAWCVATLAAWNAAPP